MAMVFADRVNETTTTTGTGTLSLGGAADGFQGFVVGIGTTNECSYCITDDTDWEIGEGTVTDASPDTLSRDTILASSNSDAAVSWSSGTKNVFVVYPAGAVAVTSYTNSTNNRVLTSVDSFTVNGEANLTFDGSVLAATGNITATGTVEPAGDTAAGDNAAIGYASADGLILTGQGSTNDVTIKNDADADVISIPTGATNVTVAGVLTASGFTIGSAAITEAELELLDGLTPGTAIASKVVTTDSSIDTTGQRNLTISGELDAATLDISGNADIDGTLEADAITINGTAIGSIYGVIAGSSSIVTVGALNAGSITSGFTSIDVGAGVITGGTVEATTDTASSDNAAMGYTSAEGLILTGQGSTSDVTIKNDADATVFSIATGTTTGTFAGTVLAKTDTDTSNTGDVTLDFTANQNFVLTFTGNVVLVNPSTEQVGQAGIIVCIQDGTGSRTLSFGTDYETTGGSGITLSTAASAVDIVPYFVKAAGSIQIGAVQKAFS